MTLVQPTSGLMIAGKYRLGERIGGGGMSEVYLALNTLVGRTVALKLLHSEQARDGDLTARFFQEAQAVNRIRHPNIVDVLDAGKGETGPFIVMEYLHGESVAQVLSRTRKLTLTAAIATLLPVLDALGAAHEAGVIHRDLKPENVFYSAQSDGEILVKLLDFGIAKSLSPTAGAPRTSTGIIFGTPEYLSPEQANGQYDLDGRSDLFSVGVLFYELLSGKRPFHAPTAIATAYKVAHAKTPLLRENGGPHDELLDRIIDRALRKQPEERYQRAEELAAELRVLAPSGRALTQSLRPLVRVGPPPSELSRARRDTPRSGLATPVRRSSPPPSFVLTTTSEALAAETRARPRPNNSSPLGIRSLPSRFVGQCHARGVVLDSVDRFVTRSFGEAGRAAVLDQLTEAHARDFNRDMLQGIVYYDLGSITSYFEAATQDLYGGNPQWARVAGAEAIEIGELANMLRAINRSDESPLALRRLVPICSRFFDFGLWDVTSEKAKHTSVRVSDFEPASLPVRLWLTGLVEAVVKRSDPRAKVQLTRGEAPFAPHLIIEVSSR